jgi:hypothetical protein
VPTKWQHTVRQIPKEHIVPGYLGQHKLQALFGDKFLGAAAASAIHNAYVHQRQQQPTGTNNSDAGGSTGGTHSQNMTDVEAPAVSTQIKSELTTGNYEYSKASATKLFLTALSNKFFCLASRDHITEQWRQK